MDNFFDFSHAACLINTYGGSDGKIKVRLNDGIYMLKFGEELEDKGLGDIQEKISNMPISEYLACHIYQSVGLETQRTLLGAYKGKLAVACKDFIDETYNYNNFELVPFKKLVTSFLGTSKTTRVPKYETVVSVLNNHEALSEIREEAIDRYWDQFIVDALVGNFDRHDGNWGYILDKSKDKLIGVAPVYDCGSSFYPRRADKGWEQFINEPERAIESTLLYPQAALDISKTNKVKKASYKDFLVSDLGDDARRALYRIYNKIDTEMIDKIIDNTPVISDVRKRGYKQIIKQRRDIILKPAYEMFLEEYVAKPTQKYSSKVDFFLNHKEETQPEKPKERKKERLFGPGGRVERARAKADELNSSAREQKATDRDEPML